MWSLGVKADMEERREALQAQAATSAAASAAAARAAARAAVDAAAARAAADGAALRAIEEVFVTQAATLAVHATNEAIRVCLAAAPALNPLEKDLAVRLATAQARSQAAMAALALALRNAPHVFHLWAHAGRLAELAERKRRRDRLIDRTVSQVLRFAAPPAARTPPDGDPPDGRVRARRAVVYIGDWIVNRQGAGVFAKKLFVRRLARRAIVVVCSEYNTTKLCGHCGTPVLHPKTTGAKTHNGTVFCPDKACPSGGRFLNRDVAAACNIVHRFASGMFVSGQLGCFAESGAGRISLSGILAPLADCPAASTATSRALPGQASGVHPILTPTHPHTPTHSLALLPSLLECEACLLSVVGKPATLVCDFTCRWLWLFVFSF